ncbi:hypothetical protein K0M31_002273 [Melipona bicolor]|uniref:Uncharacterized protein n=1 Tax=Melipona bicolor TaxID=60889 RepID=A0AA40KYE1_9HYME|nr:hypothetical protein K0M31_002273 [Melipona bicolor]
MRYECSTSRDTSARTREEWEKRISETDKRKTLSDLLAFLQQQCKFLAKTGRTSPVTTLTSGKYTAPQLLLREAFANTMHALEEASNTFPLRQGQGAPGMLQMLSLGT